MPALATKKQAVREADQDAIIQYCNLPESQTKRLLILKAFERMMSKKQPEQSFHFLDRNFLDQFKDRDTMRQVLSTSMICLQPDVVTDYYEQLDGLLVALYFKNPPGRLMRTQWTSKVRSLPDFAEWRDLLKEEGLKVEEKELLDISNDKVGVLRSNTKFMFPSDNSIIKVDKHIIGQRRIGESRIIKDNFLFGLCEKPATFGAKV